MSIDPAGRLKNNIATKIMKGDDSREVAENITDDWLQKQQKRNGLMMQMIEDLRPSPGVSSVYNELLDEIQNDSRKRAYSAGMRLWERKNL